MTRMALIRDDVATNVYASENELIASLHPDIAQQAVPVPAQVQVGWRRNGSVWTAPDAPPAPINARKRVIDRQTLFAMIPAYVEFAIREYAAAVVEEADPTYISRGVVRVLLNRVDTADNINLDFPANVAGFAFLVTLNLMTQEQADTVLAGPLV